MLGFVAISEIAISELDAQVSSDIPASNALVLSQSVVLVHVLDQTAHLLFGDGAISELPIASIPESGIFVSANNTLVLTQTVNLRLSIYDSYLNQVVTFAQTVRAFNGTKSLSQALSFSEQVSVHTNYQRHLSDTLTFVQSAGALQLRLTSNSITFSQTATANVFKGANSSLALTQTLTVQLSPHFERVSQFLVFGQVATGQSVFNRTTANTFAVTNSATGIRVRYLAASNVFVPRDVTSSAKILQPTSIIAFTEAVVQHRVINRSVGNVLSLTQSSVKRAILSFHPSNSLVFHDTHYRVTEIAGRQELLPIPSVLVTKPNYMVVLQVPGAALTLRRPELGDTEAGLSKLIQKRITTGGLYTYVRRIRARKLKYAFEIPRAKFVEAKTYLRNYLSSPMHLTNWKGEIWFGYIVNNPFSIESKNRSLPCDNEDYSIELEFEGVKIHG